jgi:hypothetical protein
LFLFFSATCYQDGSVLTYYIIKILYFRLKLESWYIKKGYHFRVDDNHSLVTSL